jgi:hypothetical protein
LGADFAQESHVDRAFVESDLASLDTVISYNRAIGNGGNLATAGPSGGSGLGISIQVTNSTIE